MGRRFIAALAFSTAMSCADPFAAPDSGTNVQGVGEDAGVVCVDLQGTVSTITRGTYCVVGDVIIPSGVTLDVPPGTTFIVKGKFHFGRDPAMPDLEPPAIMGSGALRAVGTAEEPIIFRGETPETGWFGIGLSHAQDVIHLEYVTIADTNKGDPSRISRIWRVGGGLNSYMNSKGTILRHCTFTNNRALSAGGAVEIFGHGVWPDQGKVEITDTLFENNSCECGLYFGNVNDKCGGGALRLSRVGGSADLVKIERNTFRGNSAKSAGAMTPAFGGAIAGAQSGVLLGAGNVFENNEAASGDGAISCNNEPMLGRVIKEVDPSVTFSNNRPGNGCGL